MKKVVIPNRTGHYELEDLEVDISDRDIIIRRSYASENKDRVKKEIQQVEKEHKSKQEPTIGPVTGGFLDAVGIKLPHR